MKWWAGSFFWRTLAVLALALAASQAASFWLFRQQVQQPRLAMGIGQFVSHLRTIQAALTTLPPGGERPFLERLVEREGIRVVPAASGAPGRPAPDRPGMHMLRDRLRALFGPETEVFVRPGTPGVLWVSLSARGQDYWVGIPRNRVERDNADALAWWMLAGAAIALAATALIAWRLNRPLARLARAAEELGRGGDPAAVPETGPSEVRAVASAFNRMKEGLKAGERERATFLAGVSHDLRTPLSRLRLGIEMLGDRVDADAQKGMVADIEDMNAIIDQFIDYARSEATETFEPVNLSSLARECAERAARTGAQVRCELAHAPDLMLRPLAVQRLVTNLIQNAARHGRGEILVRTASSPREISIAVLDRGPGIPPAEVERLKEPFTRLDVSRSGHSGAGLGLAIVARIASAHGARFALEPREGGGLVATVAFPVAA